MLASRLRPEAPTLPADQLHPWVWDAARTFWDAGAHAVAVEQGAKSITAHTQQKTGCQLADDDLMSQVWSDEPPKAGRPRLRFPGDRSTKTWQSRQRGARSLAQGCYGAFGTSSPTSMRRTGRNSSPLSISHAYQFWLAGSTKPRSNKESDLSCGWSALGPCGIATAGPQQARAVTAGESQSQVTSHLPLQPRTAKEPDAGFESHLTASQTPGDRIWKVRPRGDASQHRRWTLRWATDRPAQRRLLPICCPRPRTWGRSTAERAFDLGWS
jgi:Protein of unknown function (Hypoth_ymh)